MKTFYMFTKALATILLLSADIYGMMQPNLTGYSTLRGLATGMCIYHIWLRGMFDEKAV